MSASLIASLRTRGWISSPRASAAIDFPFGLGANGLHEVVENAHGDHAATTGFVLAAAEYRPGPVFWITQSGLDRGEVSDSALVRFGRDEARCLRLAAGKLTDALWAVEEAIVSASVGLVVAEITSADFTATRRLALASGRHGVPVVLLLPYTAGGPTAAACRWRLSSQPSASNRFDPQAPGHPRWRARLERCRMAPERVGSVFDLEWNDETLSLHMVSGLAARPAAPRASDRAPALLRRRTG